jgi:hypothetical protein
MSLSTTIYSGWGWDQVFGTAILASALIRKGYRTFLEFPAPNELRGMTISKAYAIGITHRNGTLMLDTISIDYNNEKRLGIVIKYDSEGKGTVSMRFANVRSVTESVLEYVYTLNESFELPKEILNDIAFMNEGKYDKMTKIGRALYKAIRMNYMNKTFRQLMYQYALSVITKKSLKLPEVIVNEANKYDKALLLAQQLIKEERFTKIEDIPLFIISKYNKDEFVKENIELLKPVAYDILNRACRSLGISVLVLETNNTHTMRVCLQRRDISFVKIIASIPRDISDKLYITLKGNNLLIRFKDPGMGTIENMLSVANEIVSAIISAKQKT